MEQDKSPIDWWTIGHIVLGATLAAFEAKRTWVWLGAFVFEAVEREIFPKAGKETIANKAADAFATIGGYETMMRVQNSNRLKK